MARGGYTPRQIKEMTEEEIYFISHYQNKVEKDRMETLLEYLGVIWDLSEDKVEVSSAIQQNSNKLIIPLSVAINPDIIDHVRDKMKNRSKGGKTKGKIVKMTSDGSTIEGEAASVGELSKEEFFKLMGQKPKGKK